MGLFRITTKTEQNVYNRYFAKGMTAEVMSIRLTSTSDFNNSVNRERIAEAFMRKYDISSDVAMDIARSQLDIVRIG